jgi:hypothetical protein
MSDSRKTGSIKHNAPSHGSLSQQHEHACSAEIDQLYKKYVLREHAPEESLPRFNFRDSDREESMPSATNRDSNDRTDLQFLRQKIEEQANFMRNL